MKLFLIVIFNLTFIFISCKCNCEGDAPTLSAKNERLIIFKKDSVLDFISSEGNTIQIVAYPYTQLEPEDRLVCMDPLNLFKKDCNCASDSRFSNGYFESNDSIHFGLYIDTDKTGSMIRYSFNQNVFTVFDSTAVSRIINNKLISGLSLKELPDSSYYLVKKIYYKDSLGLVSIVYTNGTTLDLKKHQ